MPHFSYYARKSTFIAEVVAVSLVVAIFAMLYCLTNPADPIETAPLTTLNIFDGR
jgi:hypothetical protein